MGSLNNFLEQQWDNINLNVKEVLQGKNTLLGAVTSSFSLDNAGFNLINLFFINILTLGIPIFLVLTLVLVVLGGGGFLTPQAVVVAIILMFLVILLFSAAYVSLAVGTLERLWDSIFGDSLNVN